MSVPVAVRAGDALAQAGILPGLVVLAWGAAGLVAGIVAGAGGAATPRWAAHEGPSHIVAEMG